MFSKDKWEITYYKIIRKSWNWPSYSRECLLYWFRWHRVIEMSSSTAKNPTSPLRYCLLGMWRHVGTRHWSCLSVPTNYENSPSSGSKIQHPVFTSHSPQQRMNGLSSSTSWMFWGHSAIRPCGCQRGIQSHCITVSQSTIDMFDHMYGVMQASAQKKTQWKG